MTVMVIFAPLWYPLGTLYAQDSQCGGGAGVWWCVCGVGVGVGVEVRGPPTFYDPPPPFFTYLRSATIAEKSLYAPPS